MFKPKKNLRRSILIARIQEIYQNHPSMHSVNLLKEQLKQEKLQDKVFCQSIKKNKTTC
jgi:hypothetical protein